VLLKARLGGKEHNWPGRVIRVEGAIDERSRQLFIVAQVDDPYRKNDEGNPPLKIGLFVDALVDGKELKDVFVLPRAAVRASGDVILIDEKNVIRRQKVETLWSDRDNIVIPAKGAGLEEGQVVCLTPLAFPADGARVIPTIDGVAPETELTGRGPGKGKPGANGKGKGPKGGGEQAPAVSAGSDSAEKPKT
jgi:multidrug efflux system membrane fusion protein